jgi:hypothetical protein
VIPPYQQQNACGENARSAIPLPIESGDQNESRIEFVDYGRDPVRLRQ